MADLAVLANDVIVEHCAEIYTSDIALVARGYQEVAGTALLISGGAMTAAGFVVNVAAYQHGLQQTEREPFVADRNAGIAGLVVGFTGIGVAVSGVLTLALPERREVSLVVGPVTSVGFRF